ncbi:hypothetical protein [Pimelobacter simplex]|uniref:hypothetical protein n=1 Tax=Nocardioides simplex TaxID=2045 RepID=UPI001933FB97|nr:hypothetical protein [Pimelobacter simplex]
MEGVSFWEWVAMYGLDGIGAGVLGGVIAWALLRRTINHELNGRRAAEQAAERSELRVALKEVHQAAGQMMLVALDAKDDAGKFDPQAAEPAFTDAFTALFHSLLSALAAASPVAPGLADDLDALSDLLLAFEDDESFRDDRLNTVCRLSIERLLAWVRSPSEYEELDRLNLEDLLAA